MLPDECVICRAASVNTLIRSTTGCCLGGKACPNVKVTPVPGLSDSISESLLVV